VVLGNGMVGGIEVKIRDSRSSLTLAVACQLVDDRGAILDLVSADDGEVYAELAIGLFCRIQLRRCKSWN
jgi:hypothetical protein